MEYHIDAPCVKNVIRALDQLVRDEKINTYGKPGPSFIELISKAPLNEKSSLTVGDFFMTFDQLYKKADGWYEIDEKAEFHRYNNLMRRSDLVFLGQIGRYPTPQDVIFLDLVHGKPYTVETIEDLSESLRRLTEG